MRREDMKRERARRRTKAAKSQKPYLTPNRDPLSALLSPAIILPAQFYRMDILPTAGGAVALMRAVLEDAIRCFQKQFVSNSAHDQRLGREAHAWLFAEEAQGLFSFVNICSVLGLEPEYIRQGLQRWRQDHPALRQRRKLHPVRRPRFSRTPE